MNDDALPRDSRSKIKKITCLYYGPDNATIAYHRILAPARVAGIPVLRGIEKDGSINFQAIEEGDLIVVQRDVPRDLPQYRKIVQIARQFRKPIIWEIDDLLFDLPPEHPDRQNRFFIEALLPMLEVLLEADLVTVSSPGLREYFMQIRENVVILPNFLDDQIWTLRSPSISTNPPLTIGYMGGHSHKPDIEIILPVINELLARYPNRLRFVFWGKKLLNSLECNDAITHIPIDMPSYPEFVQFFQTVSVDIFIAPLRDSLFNRCKSGIKFLEYSALGVPGVYSNLDPYAFVVTQGYDGFLATTTEEWIKYLVQLIENPSLRETMGRNAQSTIKEKWLLSNNADLWLETYSQAFETQSNPKRIFLYNLIRTIDEQMFEYQNDLRWSLKQAEEQIRQLDFQLNEIQSSALWKLLRKFWKIRSLLIPNDSKIEQFYRLIKRIIVK
jgi:glycosyltransferase involved in cell wall biosynthesis